MGIGFNLVCKKCGYKQSVNLGVGFYFHELNEEVKHGIRNGDFGEEIKSFYQENPESEVMCSSELYRCDNCLDLTVKPQIRITAKHGIYEKIYGCDRCHKGVLKIQNAQAENILCPVCKEMLITDEFWMWD